MSINGYHASAPNLVSLCVDNAAKGLAGRLYTYYSPEPLPFDTQQTAFDIIENLCDVLKYPQRTQESITPWGKKPTQYFISKEMKRCVTKDELIDTRGEKATFLVHVMYRQNATWQGSVTWADKNQSATFRSALELIKLIDAAVEESGLPAEGPPINDLTTLNKTAEEVTK